MAVGIMRLLFASCAGHEVPGTICMMLIISISPYKQIEGQRRPCTQSVDDASLLSRVGFRGEDSEWRRDSEAKPSRRRPRLFIAEQSAQS